MRFVICYDVSDDWRRSRIADSLLDFGQRIQESVFFATLDEVLLQKMMDRLQHLLDMNADTIHVFAICDQCSSKARVMGVAKVPEDRDFYVL